MNVFVTFDIELWCRSWQTLDADLPFALERYVHGRSRHGDYALPKTLEILGRHGVHGVFFVEPLFAARFGIEHLDAIVGMIRAAGQEVQLHLHPEWTDEINPPPIPNCSRKRQHLAHYDVGEQTALIALGLRLLSEVGVTQVDAFRAGGFAANLDTFEALRSNGIAFDSSLNATSAHSVPEVQATDPVYAPRVIRGISAYPVSVFRDGLGKLRHAQVGACSAAEMAGALEGAARAGSRDFVIFSHNFEMLKPGSTAPDWFVVRRFEALCRLLERTPDWPTLGFTPGRSLEEGSSPVPPLPHVGLIPTAVRLVEQALRRVTAPA